MNLLPFCGAIPECAPDRRRLHYDPQHDMWVCLDEVGVDGVGQPAPTGRRVTLGITAFGLHLSGEIVAFTAKPPGALIERGRSLGSVESAKTVHALRSPLSGQLVGIHEAVEDNPLLLNQAPYGAGWLVELATDDPELLASELAQLVDAESYRQQILRRDPQACIIAE